MLDAPAAFLCDWTGGGVPERERSGYCLVDDVLEKHRRKGRNSCLSL